MLDSVTGPRYSTDITWENSDLCEISGFYVDGDGDGDGDGDSALDSGVVEPVVVLARGDAGPYDSLDQFGSCPDCYPEAVVDDVELRERIIELVVDPMYETLALFQLQPRITRLYTTMSPHEMTEDPLFDINAELPDVSNQHTIELTWDACTDEWSTELPGLGPVRGKGRRWPFALSDGLPANLRIVQLSTSGPGRVVLDNLDVVASALQEAAAGTSDGGASAARGDEGDCGCSVPGGQGDPGRAAGAGLALGLAFAAARLRRRRTRNAAVR